LAVIVADLKDYEKTLDEMVSGTRTDAFSVWMALWRFDFRQGRRRQDLANEESNKASQQYQEIMNHFGFYMLQREKSDMLDTLNQELQDTRLPEGCDRILRNNYMKSWLRKSPSRLFLCLQRELGSRNSILAAKIISNLRSVNRSLVIYHFCNSPSPETMLYSNILTSLLLSLIKDDPDLVAYTFRALAVLDTSETHEILFRNLAQALSKDPGETKYVYVIIDGLDECTDYTQERVVAVLEQLLAPVSSPPVIYKLLILGRTFEVLAPKFRNKKTIISSTEQLADNPTIDSEFDPDSGRKVAASVGMTAGDSAYCSASKASLEIGDLQATGEERPDDVASDVTDNLSIDVPLTSQKGYIKLFTERLGDAVLAGLPGAVHAKQSIPELSELLRAFSLRLCATEGIGTKNGKAGNFARQHKE